MPASTSVKSITASPVASCSRTMSPRPLTFQPVMSLVKGSAAAQAGSSSSLRPCGVVSGFSVTTQVLLRSVVESSHCPIMFFFNVAASCARDGAGEMITSAISGATRQKQDFISAGLYGGLRDRSQRRLACEPGLEIVDHQLIHGIARYHGRRTNMWQQDDILHGL